MGNTGKVKEKKLFLFCFMIVFFVIFFLFFVVSSSIEYDGGVIWTKMKKVKVRWRD